MSAVPLQNAVECWWLPIERIERGMFVAEIDRPWLDTPFMLEGLLIETESELETLRKWCRSAYVDLNRSNPELAHKIRRAAVSGGRQERATAGHDAVQRAALNGDRRTRTDPGAGGYGRGVQAASYRADGLQPEKRGKPPTGNSLIDRLLAWLRGRFGQEAKAIGHEPALAARAAKLQLPPDIQLRRYAPPGPMEAELPRARELWSKGTDAVGELMRDLRKGAPPDLRNIEQVADGLVESMIESQDAMMWIARVRAENQRTYAHCLKVALYLIALGRHIGFPRDDLVRLGQIGMLADVGMIQVPRSLLDKPGVLTPAEHDLVKQHVRLGAESLRKSMTLDNRIEQGILQHHERIDGSGYPSGLKDREIGIFGRMAAIADCFAALVTERPYAKAQSPQEALMNLYQWSGASFHEPLVEQFVQAIGVFPVGSLVELSSGEAVIVVAHNRVRRLEPRVLVLTDPQKRPLEKPFERDLLAGSAGDDGPPIRITRGLPAGAFGLSPGDYYADESASRDEPALATA